MAITHEERGGVTESDAILKTVWIKAAGKDKLIDCWLIEDVVICHNLHKLNYMYIEWK